MTVVVMTVEFSGDWYVEGKDLTFLKQYYNLEELNLQLEVL